MGTPLLYIVVRERVDLYQHLKEAFAEVRAVEIVLDRRYHEQRRRRDTPPVERRRRERRAHDVSFELTSVGWALVNRTLPQRSPAPAAPRSSDPTILTLPC